jgi:hypothetical protein
MEEFKQRQGSNGQELLDDITVKKVYWKMRMERVERTF